MKLFITGKLVFSTLSLLRPFSCFSACDTKTLILTEPHIYVIHRWFVFMNESLNKIAACVFPFFVE